MSWFAMVTPSEEEMVFLLRALYGPDWFRQPKRTWEQIWKERRGELNHLLGMRRFKMPKYQRGSISMNVCAAAAQQGQTGVEPNLQDITNLTAQIAPTPARQQYAYDSDGSMECDVDATTEASIVYVELTTQTDDANNHTNDWWPDQPETNEGLNWDIRYLNVVSTLTDHLLADNLGVDRVSGTWYNLDTVSNDHLDASHDGGIGCNRPNGTAKTPNVGIGTLTVDVEIRATGVGIAVASHSYDLDCQGT